MFDVFFLVILSTCQTGARNTTEDCRRESIDYVALNAQPATRKNGSKEPERVGRKSTRVGGNAKMVTGPRASTPGRTYMRLEQTAADTAVYPGTASPRDDESREDEDVSLFLDSFSASGMSSKNPTSASETAVPSSLLPRGETLEGQTREAEAAVIENVQATLAMSEPLAQVN